MFGKGKSKSKSSKWETTSTVPTVVSIHGWIYEYAGDDPRDGYEGNLVVRPLGFMINSTDDDKRLTVPIDPPASLSERCWASASAKLFFTNEITSTDMYRAVLKNAGYFVEKNTELEEFALKAKSNGAVIEKPEWRAEQKSVISEPSGIKVSNVSELVDEVHKIAPNLEVRGVVPTVRMLPIGFGYTHGTVFMTTDDEHIHVWYPDSRWHDLGRLDGKSDDEARELGLI